ncbi:glycosyltransferase [Chlorobium sp. KB01]|uniref:glycosyltransferase n=1 Tax=Chlorobium sp. KB01 TaxID=1917528 RepID=UPI00097718D7|nr:glycosyltransferase [Chlorobium sp. KB01]
MKISAFTFIKNGTIFGFPYTESIRSVLPIVDEFVVNVGVSDDDTLDRIRQINDPKIRIIQSHWNDRMKVGGYVYGQQKMIAQFNCTGDWAFYLEGDEIVHEEELTKIVDACRTHLDDERIEALTFDYYHFYGNANSYLDSPGWYRRAARIIRNSIRTTAPDGLFWHVLTDNNKVSRYPKSAHTGASIYHYGWVRSEEAMNRKSENVQKYWNKNHSRIDYGEIDQKIVREFRGSHPAVIRDWLPKEKGLFRANPGHILTRREKKHRLMLHLERWFGMELSKKHFDRVTRE